MTIPPGNGAVIKEIAIYGQMGKKGFSGVPNDNTLDISALQPGIYIVEVRCNPQIYRDKLIVE